MRLPPLIIQDLTAKVPIIQGGMGIGVSLSSLAGAVAREGGIDRASGQAVRLQPALRQHRHLAERLGGKAMEQDVILLADHISFHYFDDNERPIPVLKDLSLTVNRGEFVAVLGHNGSGKSTLAKHFNAILLPETGNCIVDGINTREENRLYDIRQRVGMVFQNPDNQIIDLCRRLPDGYSGSACAGSGHPRGQHGC